MLKIILGATLLFSIIGCSSNADDEVLNSGLDTTWKLSRISGGLAGVDVTYESGDIYWTFNSMNSTLTIENNITVPGPKMNYGGLESGVYNYVLNTGDSILHIENSKRGRVILTSTGGLNIDDGVEVDGLMTEFVPGILP